LFYINLILYLFSENYEQKTTTSSSPQNNLSTVFSFLYYIAEILLKVALNTNALTLTLYFILLSSNPRSKLKFYYLSIKSITCNFLLSPKTKCLHLKKTHAKQIPNNSKHRLTREKFWFHRDIDIPELWIRSRATIWVEIEK
jgi:hypothetical protein